MRWSVGEVARLAGITVRTLHHYGQIGLLTPSGRTPAGYRRYDEADLDRLTTILYYRELGFGLDEIADLLDEDSADIAEHLRRQHEALTAKVARLQAMVDAIARERRALMNGDQRSPEQKLEVFAEYPGAEYEQEAQQRWGDTEAWAQSRERTAAFGPADWTAVQADAEELESALAAAMTAGVTPDSDRARELVLQHRAWVGRFYDCDAVMHRSLGEMYVADERFAAHYDKRAPGLARWLREAINHAADTETASGI